MYPSSEGLLQRPFLPTTSLHSGHASVPLQPAVGLVTLNNRAPIVPLEQQTHLRREATHGYNRPEGATVPDVGNNGPPMFPVNIRHVMTGHTACRDVGCDGCADRPPSDFGHVTPASRPTSTGGLVDAKGRSLPVSATALHQRATKAEGHLIPTRGPSITYAGKAVAAGAQSPPRRLRRKEGQEVLCDMCDKLAAFLCSSCKQAAYCGRMCQASTLSRSMALHFAKSYIMPSVNTCLIVSIRDKLT